jgi:hypothetical protein
MIGPALPRAIQTVTAFSAPATKPKDFPYLKQFNEPHVFDEVLDAECWEIFVREFGEHMKPEDNAPLVLDDLKGVDV